MSETSIYVVKTTANQERSVANMIAQIARKEKYDIRALLVPDVLKGYVLVESPAPEIVDQFKIIRVNFSNINFSMSKQSRPSINIFCFSQRNPIF